MNTSPLVSVLMTTYNREKYIADAMGNVLASTYNNFELFIVDDCSTNRTVKIAKSYEAIDDVMVIYTNTKKSRLLSRQELSYFSCKEKIESN